MILAPPREAMEWWRSQRPERCVCLQMQREDAEGYRATEQPAAQAKLGQHAKKKQYIFRA